MDTQVAQGTTGDAAAKATRTKVFGRVYDHEAGTVTITSASDPTYKVTRSLADVPNEVLRGFALQNLADYIVGEGNDAFKEPDAGKTAQETAASAMDEAWNEAVQGQIDFRSGVGLGGMRSAIGALGAVLFELGKKKVKDQFGNELAFDDLHSARNAVKTLYLSTQPKGPFTPKVDKDGKPVLDKEGKQIQTPVNKDSGLTGRMIFNAICEIPAVKEALAAKRTAKPKATIAVELE